MTSHNPLTISALKKEEVRVMVQDEKGKVTIPAPPLSAIGLSQFSDFENMNAAGITYLDTFFSREEMRGNEAHHFHELIHVVQWRLLSPKLFVAAYADGLERCGYRASSLEMMAYTLKAFSVTAQRRLTQH